MLAQIVSMVCLVPLSIFTDRLRDKRKMVMALLLFIGGCYLCGAAVPFFGSAALYPMIVFIGLAVGGVEICTSSWQAFFADATLPEQRNQIFATRNQTMFIVNICVPLLAGFILTAQGDRSTQIITHQIYYCVITAAAVCNVWMLSKIQGGKAVQPAGKSFRDFLDAIKALIHNKSFLFLLRLPFCFIPHGGWTERFSIWVRSNMSVFLIFGILSQMYAVVLHSLLPFGSGREEMSSWAFVLSLSLVQ